MPVMRRCPCPTCDRDRVHQVVTTRHPDGRVTRELFCPFCDVPRPYGVVCPACGDCRLGVWSTRHHEDGSTSRTKICCHCRHRVLTRERVTSNSV